MSLIDRKGLPMRLSLATLGLVLSLSACSQEAGRLNDNGALGHATLNNHGAMQGELGHAVNLGRRFASEVPSTVNFAFNSAVLDGEARAALDRQADWIRQFPELRFRVYGHTDSVGSSAYNKRLGLRRANAVVRYLGTRGISRSRLEALVSYGETRPLIVTQTRERRNRRTVTEVSGFVRRHPTILDGRYAEVIYREYVASAAPASTLTASEEAALPGQKN
jgi:outer membrane protein OmpA-like peptidoglycan-associated protein